MDPNATLTRAERPPSKWQLSVRRRDLAKLSTSARSGVPEATHSWDACKLVIQAFPSPARDGTQFSPDGTCTFHLSAQHLQNYTEFKTARNGRCEGIRVRTQVHSGVTQAALQHWPRNEHGDFDPTLNAEIAGYDSAGVEMWDNRLHFFYLFNGSSVYAYSASQHHEDNPWWGLVFQTKWDGCRIPDRSGGCWEALGSSSMQFHSDGFPYSWFPDVEAYSDAYGYAYGSGYKYCDFWYDWDNADAYPYLHTGGKCYLT